MMSFIRFACLFVYLDEKKIENKQTNKRKKLIDNNNYKCKKKIH